MKRDSIILIYADLLSTTGSGYPSTGRQWQMARDRMLGYLDALEIEPMEALELALQVLGETRDKLGRGENRHPVVLSMRILRQILEETKRIDSADPVEQIPDVISLPAAPGLNPGHMVPQKLGTSTWRTRKFMNFKWVVPYIILLLVFAILYFLI